MGVIRVHIGEQGRTFETEVPMVKCKFCDILTGAPIGEIKKNVQNPNDPTLFITFGKCPTGWARVRAPRQDDWEGVCPDCWLELLECMNET